MCTTITDMRRRPRVEPEENVDGLTPDDLVCVELRDLQVNINHKIKLIIMDYYYFN